MREKVLDQKNLFACDYKDSTVFYGYASVFNVVDENNEVILPGAFLDVDMNGVKLLWQHKYDNPIGKILYLEEDKKGLFVVFELILEVSLAKEAYYLLKSGAMNGLSIGYIPHECEFDSENGTTLISSLDLWEISLVTFPANKESGVFFSEYKDLNEKDNIEKTAEKVIFLLNN